MYRQLLKSNPSPILELSVKFVSQICHENINKPLDGAYLADFGIDITLSMERAITLLALLLVTFSLYQKGYGIRSQLMVSIKHVVRRMFGVFNIFALQLNK